MEDVAIKAIKTREDHASALAQISSLMELDVLNDRQGADLEVLAILVEKYEEQHFPIELPTPTEAIQFRMDQLQLNRAELSQKIGFPRSRVSDVLNGKRSLSLDMIRALKEKLNIPAEVLLGRKAATVPDGHPNVEWASFPLREMSNYGWIESLKSYRDSAETCVRDLMLKANVTEPKFAGVAFRGTAAKKPDPYAVNAWLMFARYQAITNRTETGFKANLIGHSFRREVAKLSLYSDGPKRAFEHLRGFGITPVCVRHLSKTHIDGACFKLPDGRPAIALTLRHNRLDNFWFTLLHECAHVERHLNELDFILDETERQTGAFGNEPEMEDEANACARDALIPSCVFDELTESQGKMSQLKILKLANEAEVSPAIIAGQWRAITGRYTHFTKLVGQGKVTDTLECV